MLPSSASLRPQIRARLRRAAAIGVALLGLFSLVLPADARRGAGAYHGGGSSHRSSHSYSGHRSTYTPGVKRDSHGRIARDPEAKRAFEKQTGHPNGWPGHVVDHIVPLSRGGADSPSNMQWQTTEEAKAKDKWERGPPRSSSRSHHTKK